MVRSDPIYRVWRWESLTMKEPRVAAMIFAQQTVPYDSILSQNRRCCLQQEDRTSSKYPTQAARRRTCSADSIGPNSIATVQARSTRRADDPACRRRRGRGVRRGKRVYPGAVPVSEPAGLSRRNSGQRAGGFIPAQFRAASRRVYPGATVARGQAPRLALQPRVYSPGAKLAFAPRKCVLSRSERRHSIVVTGWSIAQKEPGRTIVRPGVGLLLIGSV